MISDATTWVSLVVDINGFSWGTLLGYIFATILCVLVCMISRKESVFRATMVIGFMGGC